MAPWIAIALAVALPVLLIALMPWRKADPNHGFAVHMYGAISELGFEQDAPRMHSIISSPHLWDRLTAHHR